jgi:DNA topoisomerase-1
MDDAMNLIRMPRTLGEFEGETVVVNNGRFGPYVLHNKKYYPIPKDSDVLTISLDEAVDIIQQKRTADASRHIKTFEENPEISILNGRFGPYISYKKKNYHLPKKLAADPTALTLQECMDVINKQENTEDSKKAQHSKKKK